MLITCYARCFTLPFRIRISASLALLSTAMFFSPTIGQTVSGESTLEVSEQVALAEDEVKVQITQQAISVIPRRGVSVKSIEGLREIDFRVWLDGEESAPGTFVVDEMCGAGNRDAGGRAFRPMLVIVDFNYMDAAGRKRVAGALREVAAAAANQDYSYKVYALTRQARILTHGFTNDASELAEAASIIDGTAWSLATSSGASYAARLDSLFAPSEVSTIVEGVDDSEQGVGGSTLNSRPPVVTGKVDIPGHEVGCCPVCCPTTDNSTSGDLGDIPSEGLASAFSEDIEDISYHTRASLAMIRAILDAHVWIPGRKAVVLFTGESFGFKSPVKLQEALDSLAHYYAMNYVFWPVEVGGIRGSRVSETSDLITAMGMDSGGGVIRGSADPVEGIRRAQESLACYYLISVPLEESGAGKAHDLRVELDLRERKDRWNLRVLAPRTKVRRQISRNEISRQSAALFMPEEYFDFPIAAELLGPIERQGSKLLIVRTEVPLDPLTGHLPPTGGALDLHLALVIEHDDGLRSRIECNYETLSDEPIHVPLGKRQLSADSHLLLELACPAKYEGRHIARIVVTNLATDEIGATRVSLEPPAAPSAQSGQRDQQSAPRISATLRVASSADMVWRSGMDDAKKNTARSVWRIPEQSPRVNCTDRLSVTFRDCRKQTSAGKGWYVLIATSSDGEPQVLSVLRPGDRSIRTELDGDCISEQIQFLEHSLDPGDYALLAFPDEVSCARFSEKLTRETTLSTENGVLSWAGFRVEE